MNWIKTDIEIGVRIKCFDIDYQLLRKEFSHKQIYDIETVQGIFMCLRDNHNKFPKSSALVRVNMPPDRMCVTFWVQDSSFKPLEIGACVEAELMEL